MKNSLKLLKTLGLFILLMMGGIAQGAIKTATTSGNWSTATTWGNGSNAVVPQPGDDIVIAENVILTVDVDATILSLTIGSTKNDTRLAVLKFASGKTLTVSGNLLVGSSTTAKTPGSIDMSLGGSLYIGGGVIINLAGGTWTPGIGTVVFNSNTDQTLPSTWMNSFNNLTLSGSGVKTISGVTVNGILSMEGTATINAAPTYGTNATLQYNTTTSRTNGIEWISNFVATGGVKLINTGEITLDKARTYSLSTLSITAGKLIIPEGAQLTVNGNLSAGTNGLSLMSDETLGTGSLIVNGTASGSATLTRAMASGAWHLVSSPLAGQNIQSFLSTNSTIPGQLADATIRAMRKYLPSTNEWSEFFTNATSEVMYTGTGYCMRVKSSTAHNIVFTGTLQAGDMPIDNLSAGNWNCIGNPYTSAIGINNQGTGTNTANFLTVNSANLETGYGIYIWDNLDASNGQYGQYTVISNVPNPVHPYYYLQQGQGFMVRMASEKTSVSFTKAMQVHDVSLTLKSTENIWPSIKLVTSGDSVSASTLVAFHDGMTNGLDPTYDAGLLKSGGSMELYSRLVEDYGIPFAIQALPSNQYDQLIIPVGVDYSKGGKVSFSAESFYLPSSCRPILEDRLTGILTDLSNKTYSADLTANTSGTGRFYLHTSYATTGAKSLAKEQQLSAWPTGNHEININGKISNGAIASLFDLQGRLILTHVLREGISDRISLPAVNPGVYLLQVRDQQRVQALKVTIGQ